MSAGPHEIVSAAAKEAQKMRSAIAGAEAAASVTMPAGQFARLATLLENLCAIADETIGGLPGDPRYWVPLEEYVRLKRDKAA